MRINNIKEFWVLVEDPSTIELGSTPSKHDCHFTDYVTKVGDKFYKYYGEFSYSGGLQDWIFPIKAQEVEEIRVVSSKWVPVKSKETNPPVAVTPVTN